MNPTEHTARAEELVRFADEAYREAVENWHDQDPNWPNLYQKVQAISALAQTHATLAQSLRSLQPAGEESVLSRPQSDGSDAPSGSYPRG